MGPCDSASARMATAFVGSCGVSMTTTPSDVVTKLGLQPRSLVFVNTFAVTRSIIEVAASMKKALPPAPVVCCELLRGRETAVDRQDVPGHERRRIGAQKDRRAGDIVRLAHPPERDPVHDR